MSPWFQPKLASGATVPVVARRLEVGEAELAVVVGADEEEVFALPGGEAGIAAARRHQAAQHLAQRAGGAMEAAAGGEMVVAGELEQEDAPRLTGA